MRRPLPARVKARIREGALLLSFLRRRRSVWTSLFVVLLLLVSVLLYVVQAAAVSPYVYSLF